MTNSEILKQIIESRKKTADFYNENLDFSKLNGMKLRERTKWNYSYYAIIFETEEVLLKVQKALNDEQIFPRRYFYPSLNTIEYVRGDKMPVSESIASRIMCLPLYFGMDKIDLNKLCLIINEYLC